MNFTMIISPLFVFLSQVYRCQWQTDIMLIDGTVTHLHRRIVQRSSALCLLTCSIRFNYRGQQTFFSVIFRMLLLDRDE